MDKETIDKIKSYLDGTLPTHERDAVRTILDRHRDSPQIIDLLNRYWKGLPENGNLVSSRRAFLHFRENIGGFPYSHGNRLGTVWRNIRNIAAVVAVPLLAASIFSWTQFGQPEMNYISYSVAHGQRDSLVLPDNSTVWLNSGSRLIYPEKFGRRYRKVFLSGEACLGVAKDHKKPFLLSTGDVTVRVLGTRFNVTSYDDMGSVTVSLIQGFVEMDVERRDITHTVKLTPGDAVRYDKATGELSRNSFSTDGFYSWRSGGFYFSDQSLSEIAAQFERVFDVQIFIDDPKLRRTRFTTAFVNNETLDQMLEAINFEGKMKIARDRDMIFITSK